jgi:phage-related protein
LAQACWRSWRIDTYRAIYTVRFAEAVYVLHVFQKEEQDGRRDAEARAGAGPHPAEGG